MWNGRTVSVILMTYAERDSIRRVIEGFQATGVVDEVLVVNNNAQAGTAEEVAQTTARQVFEARQGYGHATMRGLAEATGDLLVIAEPESNAAKAFAAVASQAAAQVSMRAIKSEMDQRGRIPLTPIT